MADDVRAEILACRACGLHRVGHGPVPYRGSAPARLAMVGEAPGKIEDEQGVPFVGPSGEKMDCLFVNVGIDPTAFFVCNTVSCYPKGRPSPEERRACRPNLLAQLAIARPDSILLLGGVPLSAFRGPAATVSEWCDRVFSWKHPDTGHQSLVWPTYHPAARRRKERERLEASVEALAERMGTE